MLCINLEYEYFNQNKMKKKKCTNEETSDHIRSIVGKKPDNLN